MTDKNAHTGTAEPLAEFSLMVLESLAMQFPICMSSDEFHFFPQYRSSEPDWSRWDDFSNQGLSAMVAQIFRWQQRLQQLRILFIDLDAIVDVEMLDQGLVTLREQIELVRLHESQPTFYLTIVSMGLAEALEYSSDAFERRMGTLPAFFQMATEQLTDVPALYCRQGIAMTAIVKQWIGQMALKDDHRPLVDMALDNFQAFLEDMDTKEDFRLPVHLYARIAEHHMGTRMGLEEIAWHLDREVEESAQVLSQNAAQISLEKPWPEVWLALPSPTMDSRQGEKLFRSAIAKLKGHCRDHGFFDPGALAHSEVAVKPIPEHQKHIRANAAYSMPVGHPPKGGTFFIMPMRRQRIPRGLMMLAAHETYPGHHLMDTMRWQHANPLRRSLEFPLFYEGWACLAEEMLFETDFFSGPADELLMAKRRYLRALRGQADLAVHTGKHSLKRAAEALCRDGLVNRDDAMEMVKRYALKPGYQLAYTIGRRKFRQLYTAYLGRGKTPAQFARKVLAQGEIGFERLAERLLY